MSSISELAFEALHLYAAAARSARDGNPRSVARQLPGRVSRFPRGTVTLTDPETVRQHLHLAEARVGGFDLISTSA